jgi:hypothetical protein
MEELPMDKVMPHVLPPNGAPRQRASTCQRLLLDHLRHWFARESLPAAPVDTEAGRAKWEVGQYTDDTQVSQRAVHHACHYYA